MTKVKRQSTEGEKILSSYLSDGELISRIYEELKKLNTKRTNNLVNKWASELKGQFSKEVQMANKHLKTYSTSFSHQGNANRNDTEIPSHPIRMAVIKKINNNKLCQDVGWGEGTLTVGRNVNCAATIDQYKGSSKN
jgi:sortase (surface protein transpeptidase)